MKNFDRDALWQEVRLKSDQITQKSHGTFEKAFFEVLNQHATEKNNHVRANQKPCDKKL